MARHFITLCALALFAVVASAVPVESDVDFDYNGLVNNVEGSLDSAEVNDLEVENQRGFGDFTSKFFDGIKEFAKKEYIGRIKLACVFEVPTKCGLNFRKTKEYYTCALNYIKEHKEHCIKAKV